MDDVAHLERSKLPKLFLADQSLTQAGGHHLTYNSSLADAAYDLGISPFILANKFADPSIRALPGLRPTFSSTWYNDERPYGMNASGFEAPVLDLFAFELFGALDDLHATSGDHVFLHSIGFYEIAEIHRALLTRDPKALPVLHLLCRRDLEEAPKGSSRRREFEFSLTALARNRDRGIDVRFYTDTPELSRQYTEATGVAFETLPLPFPARLIADLLPAARLERARRLQTRFCYLGDARDEKGYQHLPGAIARISPDLRNSHAVHFTLQSNFNIEGGEPGSGPARAKLRSMPRKLVDLRMQPLSEHDYYAILGASDAVLVPYDVTCYSHRSSGIFTEALHLEAIPIVPSGTSMAAQLPDDFPTVFSSPRELPQIFETVHRDKAALRATIAGVAAAWRAIHTPEGIVQRLLRKPPVSVLFDGAGDRNFSYGHLRPELDRLPAAPPCALVQIDLESFYYRVGAARTMELQIATLQALGFLVYTICAVHNNLNEGAHPTAKPSHWFDVLNGLGARLKLAGAWLCWNGRIRPDGGQDLESSLVYRRQATVPAGLREFALVARPSFILVNYPQNISVIDKLGLGYLPIVIETHDVQSLHIALYDQNIDLNKSLATEVEILKRAVAVSCVTEEDADALRELGVTQVKSCIPVLPPANVSDCIFAGVQDLSELLAAGISNSPEVDIETAWREGRKDQLFRLHNEKSLDLLFIGSWHRPNIEGFRWFHDKVFLPLLEPEGVNCFVVGGMSVEKEQFPSQKIFWGGTLENLSVCAAGARIIIAPLLEGTGINVKVLEAIEMAKPIVATSVALRGIPRAEQIVGSYDDPKDFAHRVIELLSSKAKRRRAVEETRRLHGELLSTNDYALHIAAILPDFIPPPLGSILAQPSAPKILEFTNIHEIANRIIRIMANAKTTERAVFDIFLNRLETMSIPEPLLRFVDSLYVTRDAPILAVEGFRDKHQTTLFGAPSARDAMFKIWAHAIATITAVDPPFADLLSGATTIGEVLARAGGGRDPPSEHALALQLAHPPNDIVARIANGGFDIVLWFGPNDWCQDAAAWIYNNVIKVSPRLREKTILVPGPASKHRFLDGHVFFTGPIEHISILPLLGRTLVLGCESAISLHPDWLRLALIANAVGTAALAIDLSVFGESAPPSLGRDVDAWERELAEKIAKPRPVGCLKQTVRKLLHESSPRLEASLDLLASMDMAWSSFQAESGRFLAGVADEAPAEDLIRAIESLTSAAQDPRRRKTLSLRNQALRRRLEDEGKPIPDALEALDLEIAVIERDEQVAVRSAKS